MQYEFEYFYIYEGKLLLSESIETMEELLDLAAVEKHRAKDGRTENGAYLKNSSTAFNSSR